MGQPSSSPRLGCLPLLIFVVGFLLSILTTTDFALADTVTVSIPAERDTNLMEAHPQDSDGAAGFLWLKWNGQGLENRVAVGFDLTPLAGRTADVVSATVLLTASSHTFPARNGALFYIHAMDPDSLVDWAEGDTRFSLFSYCNRKNLRRPPSFVPGPAATWTCDAQDLVAGAPTCLTPWSPPTQWLGGFALADAPDDQLPRGFRTPLTGSIREVRGYDPSCSQALSCFASTGNPECWRRVSFDVTADIREMLAIERFHPSWLIRKNGISIGGAYFFSREGAVCVMGIPSVGPQLLVTLTAIDGDPPTIPDPPDHCATIQK